MSRLLGVLAVALAACSNAPMNPVPSDAGVSSDRPTPTCALRFEGDAMVRLRTSERRRLRMVVTPPTAGVNLRVGVVGVGLDSSLADTRLNTGPDGSAETELTASTDSATFRVRATADCGAEASVEVAVGDRGFGSLAADAVYRGARTPTRLELGVVPGTVCPASVDDPARRTPLALPGGVVRFGSLPADLTFTVWAEAVGDDGAVLARGCAAPQTVHADVEATAPVLFVDRPLRLDDRYTLDLELDLAATAPDLRTRWTAPIRREILASGSTAGYVAREVSRAVATASGSPDAGVALQAAFETALRSGLGARFDAEVVRRGSLLEDSFDDLAETTAQALTGVRWRVTFAANAAGDATALSASGVTVDPGTPDVSRDDTEVALSPEGTAAISVGTGDIVTVSLQDAGLPWTQVARGALGAVTRRFGASTTGDYAAASLCPVAVMVLRDATGVCDAACIQGACRRAVDELARAFDGEVASQLAARSATTFRMAAVAAPAERSLVIGRAHGMAVGRWTSDESATLGGRWTLQRVGPAMR